MIQTPKTPSQFIADMLLALKQTGIRQTSPGGKARAFSDTVANKMGEMEGRQFLMAAQVLLPYATADSLDLFGQMFGVTRVGARDATSPSTDSNFQFYVTRGTFGAINQGQDIIIPAGTQIFTADQNGPTYTLDFAVILAAGDSSQTFSASSQSTGSSGNAPAGVFNQHSFINYADSGFGSLLVTNNYGIVAGRDVEDDSSYRYRIQLRLQSRGGSALSDVRGAVLEVPGIQDVVFQNLAGTFLAYIYSISPVVAPSLLQLVQDQINQTVAYPLSGTAVAPDLVGISLATTLTLRKGLSQSDQQVVLSTAAQAAENYVNNLAIGDTLVINTIADVLRQADTRILDVGDPDRPLQQIFIWRSRLDNTRYSRYLVTNYTPSIGERIVVENIPTAISLVAQ